MSRNIAAFTESVPDVSYPAYLSANYEDDGRIVLTARERGNGGNNVVNIEISAEDLLKFAQDVLGRTNLRSR